MTNNINGIDVSECEFLECGMCNAQRNCDGYTGIECKYDNENCYYRQLKRLQEENEKLKERLSDAEAIIMTYKIEKEQYKQALEEIREILMCKIYGLNENASQLDYMCYVLDKFEKIRIKILTKINEVLKNET